MSGLTATIGGLTAATTYYYRARAVNGSGTSTNSNTINLTTVSADGSGTADIAPTTVTAQAGWTTVYASSSVRVPKGRSLALIALTTTPARAQSPPVPVAGASLHC